MQYLIGFLQESFIYVAACVILLGILVFVHELGHFLVARWCGVRVEVFSLGFGKKIWSKTVGDTVYCISMIPLGGYVKMFGEQPGDQIPEASRAVSFTHKPVQQRIAIVLAGPLMNLLFAVVVFAVVAMLGMDARAPILGDLTPGSAAESAGFQAGDKITRVGGQSVTTFDDVADMMNHAVGSTLQFQVERADGTHDVQALITGRPNPNPLSLSDTMGDIEGLSTLSRSPLVGIPHESLLWTAGLRSGDRILSVNGRPIRFFREIAPALTVASDQPMTIEAQRTEGNQSDTFTITLAEPITDVQGAFESPELYLDQVMEKSPAEAAGLKAGDRITAVNGKKVARWEDVLNEIRTYKGEGGIALSFKRDNEAREVQIEPQITSQLTIFGGEDRRYTIGIITTLEAAAPDVVTVRTANPLQALVVGAKQSWEFSVITVLSFVRLFQNKLSPKTVGGLLSIGQAAGETIKLGLNKFLTMMAIISINLFILNLLPVPVLDGGHLVFYTIEAIKGSPMSLRKVEVAQQVGLVLLMGLMVFALFNDVTRLIFGRM